MACAERVPFVELPFFKNAARVLTDRYSFIVLKHGVNLKRLERTMKYQTSLSKHFSANIKTNSLATLRVVHVFSVTFFELQAPRISGFISEAAPVKRPAFEPCSFVVLSRRDL